MKPKHQRLVFVVVSVLFLCTAVLLVMQAFKQNIVYFYSPSDIAANPPPATQKIRVGGLVKMGSIVKGDGERTEFIITDNQHDIGVHYRGLLPNLFREGQGVIAEGVLENGAVAAANILAKHDENYMPKEVVDALKKSGQWKGQDAR